MSVAAGPHVYFEKMKGNKYFFGLVGNEDDRNYLTGNTDLTFFKPILSRTGKGGQYHYSMRKFVPQHSKTKVIQTGLKPYIH